MFAMYEKDPLELQLALEYWCPPEPVGNADGSAYNTVYNYRPPQRKVCKPFQKIFMNDLSYFLKYS